MENDISLVHKFAKNVWACNTLWYYSQEKMGGKLRFHGFICFCSCVNLLGNMGSQDVLWLEAPFYHGFLNFPWQNSFGFLHDSQKMC